MRMPDQPLVARDEPMRRLDSFLDRGMRGEAITCFVSGEPGSGKSSLLQMFAVEAQRRHQDLLVAYGACDAFTGTGDAYLPFREILRLLTGDVAESLAEGRASEENASRLHRFMRLSVRALVENGPDLVDIFVPGGALLTRLGGKAAGKLSWVERLTSSPENAPATRKEPLNQDNVFEQYTQVLTVMAEKQPLLLMIDDLHWADRASLGLLFHLARRLLDDAVLVVCAYRPEELTSRGEESGSLSALLGELKRLHGDIVIDLDEVRPMAFVDAMIDRRPNRLGGDFRAALNAHSSGNPLFTAELLRQLEETGAIAPDADGHLALNESIDWRTLPSRISGVIEARVNHLDATQREMLDIASVHGEEFYAETIATLMQQRKRDVIRALSGILQKQLRIVSAVGIRTLGDQRFSAYRFRHNLFQHFLYAQLDPIERSELHAEIGALLEAAVNTGPHALSLARHFAEAGQWPKAIRYFIDAGKNAVAAYAPAEAIAAFERALELNASHGDETARTDMTPVIEELASQLLLAGRYDSSIARFKEAIGHARDPVAKARLLRTLSVPHQRIDAHEEAIACLDEAEQSLEATPNARDAGWWHEWLEIQLQRSQVYYWCNERVKLQALIDRLRPSMEQWGTPAHREAFYGAQAQSGLRQTRYRPDRAVVDLARAAYPSSEVDGVAPEEPPPRFLLGLVLLCAEEFDEAVTCMTQSLEAARRRGDVALKLRALTYLSIAHRRCEREDAVERLLPEIDELSRSTGLAAYEGIARAQAGWLAWRRGATEEAARKSQAALELWQAKIPGYPFQWTADWVATALAADVGDWRAAIQHIAHMHDQRQMRHPGELQQMFEEIVTLDEACGDSKRADLVKEALRLAKARRFL